MLFTALVIPNANSASRTSSLLSAVGPQTFTCRSVDSLLYDTDQICPPVLHPDQWPITHRHKQVQR